MGRHKHTLHRWRSHLKGDPALKLPTSTSWRLRQFGQGTEKGWKSGASANLPTLLFQCCFMRISQSYFYVILKNSADVAASQHFCLNVRPKKRWQCANLCQVNEVVSHWRKEFVGKRRDASITRSRSRSQELQRTMKMQGEDAWSIWEGFLFSCFVFFIFAGYCRILWFCLAVYW